MPAKLYPFIDIAVHERVRAHFARGDAAVLFSPDMSQVLWANGEGALLFGLPSIYDFIDGGANRNDAAYRQMDAAARQLERTGDRRSFLMRIAAGFQRIPVNASVEMIAVRPGETAILFAAPRPGKPLAVEDIATRMISGFDDPDTHMAVLDGEGSVLAASPDFAHLSVTPQTCRALVAAVGRDSDWLVKRPVPTGKGHLPAAIGKLSDEPALHLLFAVETILGNLDPGEDFHEEMETASGESIEAAAADTAPLLSTALPGEVIEGIKGIEDIVLDGEEFVPQEAQAEAPGSDDLSAETSSGEASPVAEPEASDISSDEIAPEAGETKSESVSPDTAPGGGLLPDEALADETSAAEAGSKEVLPGPLVEITDEVAGDGGAADEPADDPSIETPSDVADTVFSDAPVETPEAPMISDEKEIAPGEAVSSLPDDGFAETEEEGREAVATSDVIASPEASIQADAAETAQDFVFDPHSRAVRFVWKIDADGRFSEISDEFATAVGPRSADVAGHGFTELSGRYRLDPGNTIGDLLQRRDTWSGKTILWPVEGTSLRVPVDLAALPTYSRNREFDGFRGFGIVRVADAVEDEQAMGLTLGATAGPAADERPDFSPESADQDRTASDLPTATGPAEQGAPSDTASAEMAAANEETADETDAGAEAGDDMSAESALASAPESDGEADLFADTEELPREDKRLEDGRSEDGPALIGGEAEDPFRGERPALKIVETQGRRASDKVIQLDNHRQQGGETLTRSEQAAFREIARQLGETFGKRSNDEVAAADEPSETIAEEQTQASDTADKDHFEGLDEVLAPGSDAAGDEAAAPAPTALVPPRTSGNSSLTPEFLDNLPVALLVHSGDDLFHANSEFLALTGYDDLEDLRQEGGIDALFAGNEDDLPDMPDGTMPDGTMMVIRSDGHLVPVSARLQSIRWEDKNALMMALTAVNAPETAEEKPADPVEEDRAAPEVEALRMETEELHSILETATDGVVVVGAEGEIRSVNRSASALFNYDDGEIRGRPFAMLFAHESQKAVLDYLAGLSGHGVASVLNDGREVIGREASGGFIPLFMTMGRLSSSNGYCAVIRDITQWKRTEEELRNAKRAAETANAHKSDFLARVSHEIRTPLNAIIGFSDMMASEHFGPIGNPRYVEYAGDIGRSGRHVLDIVNDLLDISKIEAGEMDLEFTAVEINDAVSEAVSLIQPQANSQRVIIRTSLSAAVPSVVADNRSIKQIALNILSNAIRFTPSGGQIVVSTAYEANGSVILRIRDTGVGMTRTELEQAMKPFRQVTTGARKRGDGTGLGLPLTKAMAEANRAQFSINSAPNEGTLVEISFPSQRVLAN